MMLRHEPAQLVRLMQDIQQFRQQMDVDIKRLWTRFGMNTSPEFYGDDFVDVVLGNKIGFDLTAFGIGSCHTVETVANLATADLARFDECKVILAGLQGDNCGDSVRFPEARWGRVRQWVRDGGRLWINSEWAIAPGDPEVDCLSDPPRLAEFLTALGSSLTYNFGFNDCNTPDWLNATAGAANIAQGSSLKMACTAAIGGGTTVWLSPNATVMAAGEQIGRGFVFLSGDGNIWDSAIINDNCPFLDRLLTYDSADIL